MTKDEALRMALEALESARVWSSSRLHFRFTQPKCDDAIATIKEALAQQQEPQIAFNTEVVGYVAPQRTWVGLTDEEIEQIALDTPIGGANFARAIEAKLKEKNT